MSLPPNVIGNVPHLKLNMKTYPIKRKQIVSKSCWKCSLCTNVRIGFPVNAGEYILTVCKMKRYLIFKYIDIIPALSLLLIRECCKWQQTLSGNIHCINDMCNRNRNRYMIAYIFPKCKLAMCIHIDAAKIYVQTWLNMIQITPL